MSGDGPSDTGERALAAARPAAAEAVVRAPEAAAVDALIEAAVRRIAQEVTAVDHPPPASEGAGGAGESIHGTQAAAAEAAALPEAEATAACESDARALQQAGEAAPADEPVTGELPAEGETAPSGTSDPGSVPAGGVPSPAAGPLSHVPRPEDRLAPAEPAETLQARIEPTFDRAAEQPGALRASRRAGASSEAAASLGDEARPQGGGFADALRGWFAGPWTWGRAFRLAGVAIAAYFAVVLFLILAYRVINPPTTTLIAYQWLTGTKIEQTWVPIEDISPNLLRAVVVSEDWGFCDHYGVDLEAIEKALEQAGEGKIARGASTISMQEIKNLFLSQSKSYVRKAVEIPLTVVAEGVWPKSRMLEIYLNIAEWGPGVFGAEAAARHHFNKSAARLSEREAALLAAALPNPILRDAGDPGTRTARKASVIQSRMRAAGPVADCAMTGRQRSAATEGGGAGTSRPATGWQTTVKKRAGAD